MVILEAINRIHPIHLIAVIKGMRPIQEDRQEDRQQDHQEDRQEDHQAEMTDTHAIITHITEAVEDAITLQIRLSQMSHLQKGIAKTMRKTSDTAIEYNNCPTDNNRILFRWSQGYL